MVTRITDISKYNALFKKAWEDLQARGKFTDDELKYYSTLGDTFTCLEDYFTKIRTMIDIEASEVYPDVYKYYDKETQSVLEAENAKKGEVVPTNYEFIMLPIEEPHFEINANTREIAIPSGFKKLVGVQGDHVAETLIFSIDRFFDFMDLLNTQIYIQWVDETGADRATPVNMIHYDANTGKILFGWPISECVTKEARNINFSVRFFIQDTAVDVNGNKKIQYSFNTKIHQITIAQALQPDLNADINVENVENYFLNAIMDSPSTSAPPAAEPTFAAPGLDLPAEADLDGDAYILKVQAVASDTGYIDYIEWYHQAEDGLSSHTYAGTEIYENVTNPDPADKKTVYYTEEAPGKFVPYNGTVTSDMTNLFERFFTYTIPSKEDVPERDVTGSYKAYVINRTGSNISKQVSSTPCSFPGPGTAEQVYFKTDLNEGDLMVAPKAGDPTSKTIGVEVIVPAPAKTSITYDWKYSGSSAGEVASKPELSTAANATVTEPGWYQVIATASRNRKDRSISSEICRVTDKAVAPTVITPRDDIDISTLDTVELQVELADYAQPIALYSDELVYTWEGQTVADGEEYHLITNENRAKYRIDNESALNTNTLKVYGIDGSSVDKTIAYRCAIVNKLNGDTSAVTYSNIFTVK